MGIKTVAVFSDADRNALHVQLADEAVNIGPPPANQSYIDIEKVISAVKKTNAQAVHPGVDLGLLGVCCLQQSSRRHRSCT